MRRDFSSAGIASSASMNWDLLFDVAAQHDVGTATGHVGGDRHRLRPAGLGNDLGFAGVLLGVEHFVRQLDLLEQLGDELRVFDRRGAPPAPVGRARSSPGCPCTTAA